MTGPHGGACTHPCFSDGWPVNTQAEVGDLTARAQPTHLLRPPPRRCEFESRAVRVRAGGRDAWVGAASRNKIDPRAIFLAPEKMSGARQRAGRCTGARGAWREGGTPARVRGGSPRVASIATSVANACKREGGRRPGARRTRCGHGAAAGAHTLRAAALGAHGKEAFPRHVGDSWSWSRSLGPLGIPVRTGPPYIYRLGSP